MCAIGADLIKLVCGTDCETQGVQNRQECEAGCGESDFVCESECERDATQGRHECEVECVEDAAQERLVCEGGCECEEESNPSANRSSGVTIFNVQVRKLKGLFKKVRSF